MKTIRIILADDHQIVRAGLKLLLDSQPGFRVVAQAGNGEEVLQRARELKPDLVIMDLSMPGMNGLLATEQFKAELPEIKILILTSHEDQVYFRQMCQADVAGYLLKRSAGDELLNAVRKVISGQSYYDEMLISRMVTRQLGIPEDQQKGPARSLSAREEEILRAVALGYSNKEVATQLSLSVKTVETHKVRICEKLGYHSRADMVQHALRLGWLEPSLSFPPSAPALSSARANA